MTFPVKLLLLFLSLSVSLSAFTNTGTLLYDMLTMNPNNLEKFTTSSMNPFAHSELFLSISNNTNVRWTIPASNDYSTGYYTLFSSFTTIEPADDRILDFYIEIGCSNAKTLQTLVLADYLIQDVNFISATKGAAPELARRDFLKTTTFYNTAECGSLAEDTLYLDVKALNQDAHTHIFLIKQLALYANKCHPYCEQCSSTLNDNRCETCTSSYTRQADGTCICNGEAPNRGVVALNPIINTDNFRYLCQRIDQTINMPCTNWVDPAVIHKLPFDYCSKCGGLSQEAQYLTLPFTYQAEGNANLVNPALRQDICLCPSGTSFYFTNSKFQCLTSDQITCATSGYDKELDSAAVYAYLAHITDYLEVDLTQEVDVLLSLSYKMTFRIKNAFTMPTLLNFKVYYTFKDQPVEINVGLDTTQTYSIKIKPINLKNIKECALETPSNGVMFWKCKIHIVAYHPCTNIVYMNAVLPIAIEEGDIILVSSSLSIATKSEVNELDIPCRQNNECFIDNDYSTDIFHCADQQCESSRTTSYVSGETVWIRPTLELQNGRSLSSYKQSLEFATFYFSDSSNNLVAKIDVVSKANTGVDGTDTPVFGFPIEITEELAKSGARKVNLGLTFRLDQIAPRRMLQEPNQFAITAPVSLQISIDDNQSTRDITAALIAVVIVICASIIGIVVYCLLKKKKIEEKKPEPQEIKTCAIDPGVTSLYTGRERKINEEDQKI